MNLHELQGPTGVYVETQPFPVYPFRSDFLGAAQKPHELESWDNPTLNPEVDSHIPTLTGGATCSTAHSFSLIEYVSLDFQQ